MCVNPKNVLICCMSPTELQFFFLQKKKRASQKSEWLMESQRRSGNLEPFIPVSSWLHFSVGFRKHSIWLYRSGPSWQRPWA